MIVLDTDHLSILQFPESPIFERLWSRIRESFDRDIATTVVSLEEQTRGWLATINRTRTVTDQPRYYSRLARMVDFYSRWQVLDFNDAAAQQFTAFRATGVRIATMDLKIASIIAVNNGTLLSANLRDFEKVPGLRVESWLG
jgi:tRNA(fMet)-specific endonuclease VapC